MRRKPYEQSNRLPQELETVERGAPAEFPSFRLFAFACPYDQHILCRISHRQLPTIFYRKSGHGVLIIIFNSLLKYYVKMSATVHYSARRQLYFIHKYEHVKQNKKKKKKPTKLIRTNRVKLETLCKHTIPTLPTTFIDTTTVIRLYLID